MYDLCKKTLIAKALIALSLSVLLFASISEAETTRTRTHDWNTGETCYESCRTDSFGNTSCTVHCW